MRGAHATASEDRDTIRDTVEGDSILGAHASPHRLISLVERHSRYLPLKRAQRVGALSVSVAHTVIPALQHLPIRSITVDNGTEFAGYNTMAQTLGCRVYFADARRPGQRGTCENTVGFVRRYVPKGTCGAQKSLAQIQAIADKLNHRPRKCLGYLTPDEVLFNKTPVAVRTLIRKSA